MSDSSQSNNDEIPTIAQQSNIEKSSKLSINAREFVPTSMAAPAIVASTHAPIYQPNLPYNAAVPVPVPAISGATGQAMFPPYPVMYGPDGVVYYQNYQNAVPQQFAYPQGAMYPQYPYYAQNGQYVPQAGYLAQQDNYGRAGVYNKVQRKGNYKHNNNNNNNQNYPNSAPNQNIPYSSPEVPEPSKATTDSALENPTNEVRFQANTVTNGVTEQSSQNIIADVTFGSNAVDINAKPTFADALKSGPTTASPITKVSVADPKAPLDDWEKTSEDLIVVDQFTFTSDDFDTKTKLEESLGPIKYGEEITVHTAITNETVTAAKAIAVDSAISVVEEPSFEPIPELSASSVPVAETSIVEIENSHATNEVVISAAKLSDTDEVDFTPHIDIETEPQTSAYSGSLLTQLNTTPLEQDTDDIPTDVSANIQRMDSMESSLSDAYSGSNHNSPRYNDDASHDSRAFPSSSRAGDNRDDGWTKDRLTRDKDDWSRKPKSVEKPASTPSNGGSGGSGWKRGESVPLPVTIAAVRARNDGIIRYDHMELLLLFRRLKVAPDEIKVLYPDQGIQLPILPRGMKPPLNFEDDEEQRIFDPHRENAFKWDPNRLSNTDDPETLLSKAKLILNKMSLTNFEKLSDEFMSMGLGGSEYLLDKTVDLIVSKAQMEEGFSEMYANLCQKISEHWSTDAERQQGAKSADDAPDIDCSQLSLAQSFRTKLLTRCQVEFEVNRAEELEKIYKMEVPEDVKLEKEILLKKRFTGHMRFVGEIYMKDMVKAKVMSYCLGALIAIREEEALVCLNKLLRTIGRKLQDYDIAKRKSYVSKAMDSVAELSEDKAFSSRVRYTLKDLIDLYKAGWQARREVEKAKKLGGAADETPAVASGASGKSLKPTTVVTGSKSSQDVRAVSKTAIPSPTSAPPADEWLTVPVKSKGKDTKPASPAPFGKSTSSESLTRPGGAFSALSVNKKKSTDKDSKPSSKQPSSTKHLQGTGVRPKSTQSPVLVEGLCNSRVQSPAIDSTQEHELEGQSIQELEDQQQTDAAHSTDDQDEDDVPSTSVTLSDAIKNSARATFDEYLMNGIEEEVTLQIREKVPSQLIGDVLKYLIHLALDRKAEERIKFNSFLVALHSGQLLPVNETTRGLLLVLNELDDMAMDVPLFGTWFAAILATLVANSVVTLAFLGEVPESNNFSISTTAHEFLANVLASINTNYGLEAAEKAFKSAGGAEILRKLPPPINPIEEIIPQIAEDHKLPFFALN